MQKSKKPFYGERTKRKIVREYLNSSATMDELAKLHGILGSNTIADWVKKYGNLGNQNSIKMNKSSSPIEEKEQRKKRFKLDVHLRIGELESDLKTSQQKVQFYRYALELLNDAAKEALGFDLLKKTGDELLSRAAKIKS